MHRWIIGACVFYLFGIAGYYGVIHTEFTGEELSEYFNEERIITIVVDSYPNRSDRYVTVTARVYESDKVNESDSGYGLGNDHESVRVLNEKVLIRFPLGTAVEYGDYFELYGIVEQPESFTGDTGRVFNYPGYLAAQGIYGIIKPVTVTKITTEAQVTITGRMGSMINRVYRWLFEVRTWFVAVLGKYFTDDEHGLIAGMLIGEQSLMSEDLTADFRIVGLSHIVVLSGYNITLVVRAVVFIATLGGLGYRSRRAVAVGVVPFFVIMTGAGASSARAGIMSVVSLILQIDTRTAAAYTMVVYTLTLLVAYTPLALIYSPSLHLSFIALIGLVYVVPMVQSLQPIKRFLEKINPDSYWAAVAQLIIETTSVQFFVLPYIMYMSGSFSVLSLVVNILIVPLVSLIM